MARPAHPNKHIEAAVRDLEAAGWKVELASGHAWGKAFCPSGRRGGCMVAIWSTPRVPENHARDIRAAIKRCPHK